MPTHLHTCAADRPLDDELAAAFQDAQASGADALVVVFPGDARLSRELVPVIVGLARRATALTAIALVHESPTLSFVASSLALQLPGVRVRSAATVETAGL
ncbi:MAG: hypothetical protein A2138_26540 [Deltaproteobacteria bacterium RBG_16_71_12]|nr:MAG: hypothetical protein A2138_26540 [Deltaproteobacteria bacterium RBG_16_71_12]